MAENQTDNTDKKEKVSLGMCFPNTNKASEKSYDLKGTINIDGVKYRIGGYEASASGNGKLPKDSKYWWFHRVEKLEINPAGDAFDPAALE